MCLLWSVTFKWLFMVCYCCPLVEFFFVRFFLLDKHCYFIGFNLFLLLYRLVADWIPGCART